MVAQDLAPKESGSVIAGRAVDKRPDSAGPSGRKNHPAIRFVSASVSPARVRSQSYRAARNHGGINFSPPAFVQFVHCFFFFFFTEARLPRENKGLDGKGAMRRRSQC